MPQAYVLINVDSGAEDTVLNHFRDLGIVEETYVSYGMYDLIVKIKAESMEKLKSAVTSKIRTAKHVRSTLTLIMIEE